MFPDADHADVTTAFNEFRPTVTQEIRYHFGPAWNGVAQRYRMALDYHGEFTTVVTTTGLGGRRYDEDKALFGLFSAAHSVVDCLSYAMHAIGAAVVPKAFPINAHDLKKVTVHSVVSRYESAFPGMELTLLLLKLRTSPELAHLQRVRNILVHRVVPGRQIFLSLSSTPADVDRWHLDPHGVPDQSLAPADLDKFLVWLPVTVEAIAKATARLLRGHSQP
jgi:hypothetical protein